MRSKEYEAVLEMIRERVTPTPQGIKAMREEFEKNAEMFKVAEDIRCEPAQVGRLKGEWIIPPKHSEHRVVLYLHGGGYVMGSIRMHREMVSRISRASAARCLIAEYRLAPELPFPAALEDSVFSYQWLLTQGWDPKQVVIAGDSAGGGLAIASQVKTRDEDRPLAAALVCISPWTDLEGSGDSVIRKAEMDPIVQREGILFMAKTNLKGEHPRNPLAPPLYADLRGLPPMLIQVGTSEILLGYAKRVAQKAKAAGVEVNLEVWEGMFHVWQFFASLLPEGKQAINRIGSFIQTHV